MVTLRPVQQTDIPALANWYVEAFSARHTEERWNQQSASRLLEYWLERQPDLFFLAELDGVVAGAICAAIKPWWDGNHLVDGEFFVAPDWQQQGIGRQLFKMLMSEAYQRYEIVAFDSLTFAGGFPLSWYKQLGFRVPESIVVITGNPQMILTHLG
ncbi:MAG TPA: GNAT family N-acetyltransferase [bacterium]|nr:GNAT family N-acetyltransferase [bacterium]